MSLLAERRLKASICPKILPKARQAGIC